MGESLTTASVILLIGLEQIGKAGHPKKGEQIKSGLEKLMSELSRKKVTAKTKRWRCCACGKFNHDTANCFVLLRREGGETGVDNGEAGVNNSHSGNRGEFGCN